MQTIGDMKLMERLQRPLFPDHDQSLSVAHLAELTLTLQAALTLPATAVDVIVDCFRCLVPPGHNIPRMRTVRDWVNKINGLSIRRFIQCDFGCPAEEYKPRIGGERPTVCAMGHDIWPEELLLFPVIPQLKSILRRYSWEEITRSGHPFIYMFIHTSIP